MTKAEEKEPFTGGADQLPEQTVVDPKPLSGPEPEEAPEIVQINIKDFKGIYRGPRLIEQDGRPMIDLGIIDSPALVTGIGVSVNKTALELKQLRALVEWAVQYQLVHTDYAEKVGICDCPICQAKLYVDQKLSETGGKPPAPKIVGDPTTGHYL